MRLGEESGKSDFRRSANGDYKKYFSGVGIDVGYRGYREDVMPIANSIGVDTDYPGYDGKTLPFESETLDFVHSSHCLEHIEDYKAALQEWHRVLKVGGYMIITIPHKFLYEKRKNKPSKWNIDHKRFYTPASLLAEIEEALEVNSYRIERLIDNDLGFDYTKGPDQHSWGCYEIEVIVKKIKKPDWELA